MILSNHVIASKENKYACSINCDFDITVAPALGAGPPPPSPASPPAFSWRRLAPSSRDWPNNDNNYNNENSTNNW